MPFDHCREGGLVGGAEGAVYRAVSRDSRHSDKGMHTVLEELITALLLAACGGASIPAFGCDGRLDVARRVVKVGVEVEPKSAVRDLKAWMNVCRSTRQAKRL